MAIGDDFEIQVAGNIRHTSGTTTYTVLELHRWLQGLADDASASGDDNMDITDPNPSQRATDAIITLINGYNIDDTAAQFLYGGSITQTNGDTVYSGLQVLGSTNLAATELEIVQDNAILTNYWGTGLNDGGDVLLRILVKSRDSAADIDGKRIRVQAREYGDTYDFFNVTLDEGESVAAIATVNDPQNDTDQTSVAAYGDVTNVEGYQTIDLSNGNGPQPYYSQWTFGAQPDGLKALWEWGKSITRRGTSDTIHGINGELFLGVTHSYFYDTETGTAFVEDDIITWGSGATAGTGLLLALDTGGKTDHIQILTGVTPTDGLTITNEATTGTHDVNGSVTVATVSKVFLGNYTGSLIGAHGIGVETTDVGATDTLEDLSGGSQVPPLTVDFGLTGLIAGSEVRIFRDSDSGEEAGIESSGTTFDYNYTYASDIPVFVVVFHTNYKPVRLETIVLTNTNQSILIQQIFDRTYDNP